MNFIDFVTVSYGKNGREVLTAPFDSLKVGDKVVTEFGTGKVEEVFSAYTENDVCKFVLRNFNLKKVQSKIIDLKEFENDLPNQ